MPGYGAPAGYAAPGASPAGRSAGAPGWIAAGGGFLVFISVFLPWLSGGGESMTGWEGLDSIRECIDEGFCGTGDLFVQTDPFFFNPLVPLILGGLLVLFGVLAAVMRPAAAGRPAMASLALVVGLASAVTALVNVFQVITDESEVSVGFGIVLWLLAGIAGVVGGAMALARR